MKKFFLLTGIAAMIFSCSKKEIQFGDTPEITYTNIMVVDTFAVQMSTVLLDSFATNNKSDFLLGSYQDPYFGRINAKPFLQLSVPDWDILNDPRFDSLVLILPLNHYYYGDTTVPQTIRVNELADKIDYTYSGYLYNTSSITEKPTPLGNKTQMIKPNSDDTIMVRLNDAKGVELLQLLENKADEVRNEDNFKNYLKGISVQFSPNSSLIAGIKSSGMVMRLYYHSATPVFISAYKDFRVLMNDLRFTHLTSDRSGTVLPLSVSKTTEIPSSQTNNIGFDQPSLGILTKLSFPSLRNILYVNNTVRLLKAELSLKVIGGSFDNRVKLPSKLYLAQTDGTNNIGNVVQQSEELAYDFLNDPTAWYQFNVTDILNELLSGANIADRAWFVLEDLPGSTSQINRAIFGNSSNTQFASQLKLTLLTIKNE